MLKFNSIKTKLIFYLIFALLPVFAILLYGGENYMRDILYKNALLNARMLASEAARNIKDITFAVSTKPEEIANLVGGNLSDIDKINKLMESDVKNSALIYGMALAFLPKYSPNGGYYCSYYYVKNGKIKAKQLIPPIYDYTKFDWFKKPLQEKKSIWSKPYFDKGGGNVRMSTYSVPIFNKKGEIIGIATADVSIKFLSKIIRRIRVLKTGGAFLFTSNGDVLAPLGNKNVMKKSIAEILSLYDKQKFRELAVEVFKKRDSYSGIHTNKSQYLIYYTPIRGTDWIIGVTFPKSELFLPMQKVKLYSFVLIFAGLFLVVALIIFVSKNVTSDIERIKAISLKIAEGNFDVAIPENFADESKSVADALGVMQKSLKKFMKEVEEKAKIENELKLAKTIQSSFIPNKMELKIDDIEFRGISMWAKQVGGDFYGVNKIDENRVLFYLGDVSGKGIPAALYVAILKSMIEVLVKQADSVKTIVTFLNNYLSGIVKSNAFATMFMGVIDNKQSTLEYCNAGHIPPVMFKNSAISALIINGNVPIGVFNDFDFKIDTIPLDMFDGMLIYSDGVTDALNANGEEFGEDRVLDVVKRSLDNSSDIVFDLKSSMDSFVGKADLYDDTTVFCIKKS